MGPETQQEFQPCEAVHMPQPPPLRGDPAFRRDAFANAFRTEDSFGGVGSTLQTVLLDECSLLLFRPLWILFYVTVLLELLLVHAVLPDDMVNWQYELKLKIESDHIP